MHGGEWQPVLMFLMTQADDHARAAVNGRAAGDDLRALLATVLLQEAAFESALLPPLSDGTSALDAVMVAEAIRHQEKSVRARRRA